MSQENNQPSKLSWGRLLLVIGVTAVITFGIIAMLTNIFERKQEARNLYIKYVEVSEETTDPAVWGKNWPRQYDSYKKTAESTRTRFGGHGGSEAMPDEKAQRDPWLARAFAGYAFAIDYRDRRGHAYMLVDQEQTKRVTERAQPGACLHCHASVIPTYRRLGDGDVFQGFEALGKLSYTKAHDEVVKTGSTNPIAAPVPGGKTTFAHADGAHPVSCVDCHDPNNMQLRVTRPGFITGIKAYMASTGKKDFDPNRDATRQEMRTYVCAQCHVEYYCGPKTTLFFPWANGLKVEQIEEFYNNYKFGDGHRFYDWTHAETGAEILKAQHPEFELYSQGIHARSGVSCTDCHMPYERQGAMKVSDHWVRSPLLNIQKACQPCHAVPEGEIQKRVERIQKTNFDLLTRGGNALVEMMDVVKQVRAPWDAENRPLMAEAAQAELNKTPEFAKLPALEQAAKVKEATGKSLNDAWSKYVYANEQLKAVAELHRKAQWRVDFVAAENSMGFHAPQEAARILGEAIDYARQAQIAAQKILLERKVADKLARR